MTVKPRGQDSRAIREYVRDNYVRPAARARRRTFRVVAGDVHRALQLVNRVPHVCQVLTSKKFLDENGLRIVGREGPPSGQSTTLAVTYEALGPDAATPADPILSARGAAKQLFQQLGGGEAFLKAERAAWGDER